MPSTAPSAEAAADGAVDDPNDARRSGRRVRSDHSFPREARLLNGRAYDAVFADNRRVADRLWTVLAHRVTDVRAPSEERSFEERVGDAAASVDERAATAVRSGARLGLAIAKKRARRAVDRNRVKRVARESFRHARASLDGFHVVVMNRDAAAGASSAELRAALDALWERLLRQSAERVGRSGGGRSSSRRPGGGRGRGARAGGTAGPLATDPTSREPASPGSGGEAAVDGPR